MLKKFIALVALGLVLTTLVSYTFAQCNTDKKIDGQKSACCQRHCCNCK